MSLWFSEATETPKEVKGKTDKFALYLLLNQAKDDWGWPSSVVRREAQTFLTSSGDFLNTSQFKSFKGLRLVNFE